MSRKQKQQKQATAKPVTVAPSRKSRKSLVLGYSIGKSKNVSIRFRNAELPVVTLFMLNPNLKNLGFSGQQFHVLASLLLPKSL